LIRKESEKPKAKIERRRENFSLAALRVDLKSLGTVAQSQRRPSWWKTEKILCQQINVSTHVEPL
jgi:hypothetical protein